MTGVQTCALPISHLLLMQVLEQLITKFPKVKLNLIHWYYYHGSNLKITPEILITTYIIYIRTRNKKKKETQHSTYDNTAAVVAGACGGGGGGHLGGGGGGGT